MCVNTQTSCHREVILVLPLWYKNSFYHFIVHYYAIIILLSYYYLVSYVSILLMCRCKLRNYNINKNIPMCKYLYDHFYSEESLITVSFTSHKLTFSCQQGLWAVAAAAITGCAGVAAAVFPLHPLNRQSTVVMAQNDACKQNRLGWWQPQQARAGTQQQSRVSKPEPSTTVWLFLVQSTVGLGLPSASQCSVTMALRLTLWSVRLLSIRAASRPEIRVTQVEVSTEKLSIHLQDRKWIWQT